MSARADDRDDRDNRDYTPVMIDEAGPLARFIALLVAQTLAETGSARPLTERDVNTYRAIGGVFETLWRIFANEVAREDDAPTTGHGSIIPCDCVVCDAKFTMRKLGYLPPVRVREVGPCETN